MFMAKGFWNILKQECYQSYVLGYILFLLYSLQQLSFENEHSLTLSNGNREKDHRAGPTEQLFYIYMLR